MDSIFVWFTCLLCLLVFKVRQKSTAGYSRRTMSFVFFFSSRRRHTRFDCDWSSDVCSSDLRPNDLRPQHQLTPMDVRVVATDPLRAASERPDGSKLTVTVVPVIEPEDAADYKNTDLLTDPLLIQHASVITYG